MIRLTAVYVLVFLFASLSPTTATMPPSFATAWVVVEPEPEPVRTVDSAPDFRTYVAGPARKAEFLDYLKPLIAAENRRVLSQRRRLQYIATQAELTDVDAAWLARIAADYKVQHKEASKPVLIGSLLQRVDIVPVSLALAQAAKESAWGTSRFAVEANNFFGEWCFRPGCGLVPLARATDGKHEVEAFSSASASVGSYLRNLNTHGNYRSFRMAREALREAGDALSGLMLADELVGYSERREDYVEEVKHLIRVNRLTDVPARPDAQHSVDAGG